MNADDEGTLRRSQSLVSRAAPTGSAARNKRQDEFNQIFELTHEELLEDYSCAYQSDKLLYHGRMYVSRNYVCFHSQIFKKTIKILEFRNIQDVQKKNTAIVFPNALELTVKNRKAYKLVSELWEESKRNRVFKSLAVKEARKKHDEDMAREASFEVASDSSTEEDESVEEGSEETDSSDSEPFEDVVPSALPRSAPTPTPLALASSPTPADSMFLAPPDDGASSAKSVSPPSSATSSTLPSPPSNSAKLRNLSVNISQNVNGWVHSVGWPMNKLRADDGTSEATDVPPKKDIELREFSSDGESRTAEEDQETRLSSPDEHHEAGLKDPEHSTTPSNSTLSATEGGAVAPDAEPSKDGGGDRETSQKSEPSRSKEKEENGGGGGGDGDEKTERGSRRKRREDKEKTDEATAKVPEPPAVVQTAVPVLEACSHISAGWSSGQAMVNVLLPIAVGDMFWTFFDDKNPDVPVFWNELHTQEPLSYTEVSMGQWTPQTDNCCLRRGVGFRVALKHPLGPKSTRVQQEQRIHYMNKDTLVMETTSVSLDVPYGETFTTDTRWVMSAATANGKPATRVTVNVDIKFTKSVWIKGVIQSNAVDGVSTYFPAWAERAQRLLASKARAATAAAIVTASPKRTSRKGGSSSTRSSKRQAAPGSETPSKLRKSRRRALGDEKDRPDALASASGVAVEDEGTVAPPTFMDTSFNSLPLTPREEESLVASLIHMVFPNLPVPRLPFSLSAVVGVAFLIALAYFLLPALLSLPSLSGRVASLESDLYKLRRLNTHLKDRVLFMQLALSSLTSSADPGDPAAASNEQRDALPELWRYWKLHRHLRERVDSLVLQLRKTHDLLGHLRDDVASVVAPTSPDNTPNSPPPPADEDYVTDAFLHTVARALDAAADDDMALLDRWSLEEDAQDGGGFWSWVWFLFKLAFVWLPLTAATVAMVANTLGLLPPLLPFPLPFENALRPYASFLPLPPPCKPHQA